MVIVDALTVQGGGMNPHDLVAERVKETVVDQRDRVLIHEEIRESAG